MAKEEDLASVLGIDAQSNAQFLSTLKKSMGGRSVESVKESLPREVVEALKNQNNIFGRFVLVAKIGEGAMGAVHKAYDVELSRYVAIKFIKSQQVDELKHEARTLAGLEHKNIARIYDVGSEKGLGFIAMQFIDGKSLDRLKLSRDESLHAMILVCDAVDFAHKRGVIHRDIKPENVMRDSSGNVFVTDFGLASKKPIEGEVAGTPGFIAPEMTGSIQGDVYSLGATLYALLAGRPPIDFGSSQTIETILAKTKTGAIEPLRKFIPEISSELEAIISQSLQHDPAARYSTAHEMAEDIRAFVTGYPVSAFGSGVVYRVRKAVRRHSVIAAVVSVAIVVIVAIAFFAVKQTEDKKQSDIEKKEAVELAKQLVIEVLDGIKSAHEDAIRERRAGAKYSRLKEIAERAFSKYKKVQQFNIRDAQVEFAMGKLYRIINDEDSARKHLESAVSLDPSHGKAHYELAAIQFYAYKKLIIENQSLLIGRKMGERAFAYGGKGIYEEILNARRDELEDERAKSKRMEMEGLFKRATALLDKDSAEFFAATGAIEYSDETVERTRQLLEKAISKDKAQEEALTLMARILLKAHETEKGFKLLEEAVAEDKGNVRLYRTMGELMYVSLTGVWFKGENAMPLFKKAIAIYDKMVELNDDDQKVRVERASQYLGVATWLLTRKEDQTDYLQLARKDLDIALKLGPPTAELYGARGNLFGAIASKKAKDGFDPTADFKEAVNCYDKAIAMEKTTPYIAQRVGIYMQWASNTQKWGGDYAKLFDLGAKDVDELVRLNPRNPIYKDLATQLKMIAGMKSPDAPFDPDKILEVYEERLKENPNATNILYSRAQLYCDRAVKLEESSKDPSRVIESGLVDIDRVIGLEPGSGNSYALRATLLSTRERNLKRNNQDSESGYSKIISDLKLAVKYSPDRPDFHRQLADAYWALAIWKTAHAQKCNEEMTGALSRLDEAVKLQPNNSLNYLVRANYTIQYAGRKGDLGQDFSVEVDKVLNDIETAKSIMPGDKYTLEYCGSLYIALANATKLQAEKKKYMEEAISHYDRAYSGIPQTKEMLARLSDAYSKLINAKQDLNEDISHELRALLECCTRFIGLSPDSAKSYFLRGWCKYCLKEYGHAVEDFEKGASLEPDLVPKFKQYWDDAKRQADKEY